MSGDNMGNKQRAWLCAGCGSFRDPVARSPRLLCAEGERPLLALPARYGPEDDEIAYGWAICELSERGRGWLFIVGRVIAMSNLDAEVA